MNPTMRSVSIVAAGVLLADLVRHLLWALLMSYPMCM